MITTPNRIVMTLLPFTLLTLLLELPVLEGANKLLAICLTLMFAMSLLFQKVKIKQLVIFLLSIFATALMIVQDLISHDKELVYLGTAVAVNANLYLPTWCFFFLYLQNNFEDMIQFLKGHNRLLNGICLTWNFCVLISFAYPGAYSNTWDGVYFSSFTNGEHRFASVCVFAMAISWVLALQTGRKGYYGYALLPLVGILMCGARTYLAVATVIVLGMCYCIVWNGRRFLIIFPLILVLTVIVVLNSPIGEKFANTMRGEGYGGYWFVVTSGRSAIWAVDINEFYEQSLLYKLIGGGGTYAYKLHYKHGYAAIWAHNDFFQLLISNGLIGLYLYLTTILEFTVPRIRALKKAKRLSAGLSAGFYIIWIFNAFFNGVYAYSGAMFSLPFLFYAMVYAPELKEETKWMERDKSLLFKRWS